MQRGRSTHGSGNRRHERSRAADRRRQARTVRQLGPVSASRAGVARLLHRRPRDAARCHLRRGRRGVPDGLPFTPWAAEVKKQRMAVQQKDNPDAWCLPMGFMQFHAHGQPRRMIQTPELIMMLYEANYGLRYIFTDAGRRQAIRSPGGMGIRSANGTAIRSSSRRTIFGTIGWLDVRGSPFTDQAKITERFRRVSFGKLEIDVTVDDSEGLHEAVHRAGQPAISGRRRADRVHLQREPTVPEVGQDRLTSVWPARLLDATDWPR